MIETLQLTRYFDRKAAVQEVDRVLDRVGSLEFTG